MLIGCSATSPAILAPPTSAPSTQAAPASAPPVVVAEKGASAVDQPAPAGGNPAETEAGALPSGPAIHEGATCLAEAPKPPASAALVTVKRAVDGDTIELADGTRVRLIGINTPETVDPRRPVEAYGKEASRFTAELLSGQEILMALGRQPIDRYGRTLGWLWLQDGRFVNGLLVEQGYAQVATYADNPDHAEFLRMCEREAREAGRGLWGLSDVAAEPETAPEPPAASAGGGALTLTRAPGTVRAGGTASVGVEGTPGVSCSITVTYKSGPSKAQGLGPKTIGTNGVVSWSWAVGSNTAAGTWPVQIRCGNETVQTSVTVQR